MHLIYTDIKPDNIMFDVGSTRDDFADLIATDPPRLNAPDHSWECTVQTAVSQSLPLQSLSEAMARTSLIADFGSGK